MESSFPLLFFAMVGFSHAFETDHMLAVSNIVVKRRLLISALKDGLFWGLGHSSTILLVGVVVISSKSNVHDQYLHFFELLVGLLLFYLGVYRLYVHYVKSKKQIAITKEVNHKLAYGIGLLHGFAGSGAVALLVIAKIQNIWEGITYLIIFGGSSLIGMMIVAGVFSFSFSKKILNVNLKLFQLIMIHFSSFACIGYGIYLIIENIFL